MSKKSMTHKHEDPTNHHFGNPLLLGTYEPKY